MPHADVHRGVRGEPGTFCRGRRRREDGDVLARGPPGSARPPPRDRSGAPSPAASTFPPRGARRAAGPTRPLRVVDGPRRRGRGRGGARGSRCGRRPHARAPSSPTAWTASPRGSPASACARGPREPHGAAGLRPHRVLYACLRIGAVVVVADPGSAPRASPGQLRRRPGLARGHPAGLPSAGPRLAGHPDLRRGPRPRVPPGPRRGARRPRARWTRPRAPTCPRRDPDADAAVLFTSGSTGPPGRGLHPPSALRACGTPCAARTGSPPARGSWRLRALRAARHRHWDHVRDPGHGRDRAEDPHRRALADAASAIQATAVFLSPRRSPTSCDPARARRGAARALELVELLLSAGAPSRSRSWSSCRSSCRGDAATPPTG